MEIAMDPLNESDRARASSPPNSPTNKRTFSELEGPNAPVSNNNKLLKHCDEGQENHAPSRGDLVVPLDKQPAPAVPTSHTPSTPPRPQNQPAAMSNLAQKKPKLSPSSKDARKKEKEEKDRLKIEEKAKRAAEKKARDEERKKKEAEKEEERKKRELEREEKKKQKEEERQAREDEKRKKEEEKSKKERSQMRLNAFFSKPAVTAVSATGSAPSSPSKDTTQATSVTQSPAKGSNTALSDYRKEFPIFFLQSHTHMSPSHQFQRDSDALRHIQPKLDNYLKHPTTPPSYRASELFDMIPYKRRNGANISSVKTILAAAQNNDTSSSTPSWREQLKNISMKSLKFAEDVRPPYYGTYTKPLSKQQAHRACRNPLARILPDVNYDYDSEAEWEEPEDGEDLDSEGEEDLSDDGDDDMDGFLDDEDEQTETRRRLIVGDQEPVCTGIRWEDGAGIDPEMTVYRIELLSDTMRLPIDPFSTEYWPKPRVVEFAVPKAPAASLPVKATLHAYSVNSPAASTHLPSQPAPAPRLSSSIDGAALSKGKKPFPPEHMDEFRQTVEGCDLTKAGLIEVLKKRFPKVSKDTLKDTVNAIAVRVGQKEADKKWTCK